MSYEIIFFILSVENFQKETTMRISFQNKLYIKLKAKNIKSGSSIVEL